MFCEGPPSAQELLLPLPRNGSVVFEVSFVVSSLLQNGGWCTSDLIGGLAGFVLCPFVELQVGAWGTMSTGT